MEMKEKWALAALAVMLSAGAGQGTAEDLIVYVFDQDLKAVLRIQDINHDWDTRDPGEVVIAYDQYPAGTGVGNSQGMVALGPDDLLVTDNYAPPNIVRLRHLNGDHDFFDADEATVWFGGSLPGGRMLEMPVALIAGPDGAFYLFESSFGGSANPDAIYRLEDLNGDGDVNDADEVELWVELSPGGISAVSANDLEFDNAGYAYFSDTPSGDTLRVKRIDPVTREVTEYLTDDMLLSLTGYWIAWLYGGPLAYNYFTDEIVLFGYYGLATDVLLAIKDRDGNGVIDQPNEVRELWHELSGTHAPEQDHGREYFFLPDGSLLVLDMLFDRVKRLSDNNGDGDYNDSGETIVLYDAAQAALVGQPAATRLLSLTAMLVTTSGDVNCDSAVNVFDIDPFVLALTDMDRYRAAHPGCDPGSADINGDGAVNVFDIDPFVSLLVGG